MTFPTSVAEIEQMIRDQVQENIHLDYKDSRAVHKGVPDDLAKDVSAFANSDGGVLIHGVREKDHAEALRPASAVLYLSIAPFSRGGALHDASH